MVEVGSHGALPLSQDAPTGQGDEMTDKTTAIDPVCQMTVDTATAEYRSFNSGQAYYFCSAGCKLSFDKNREKFIRAGANSEGGGQ
jgi:Cu+-exporting ATPase